MRKIILALMGMFCAAEVFAAEIYSCAAPAGWDNLRGRINETETFSGYNFVISGDNVIVEFGGESLDYPVRLLRDTPERIDIVGIATISTELFTINKKENILYYVKNGIIKDGYSMMMKAECKKK